MKLKVELLLRLLCAYEQNGIADFSYRSIKFYGGDETIRRNLNILVDLGKIERLTTNGNFSKYKINEYLDCPEFLFDENIDIKYKTLLLGLYKIRDNIKNLIITENILLNVVSTTKAKQIISQYNVNKDFENLKINPIKKSIFESSEYLVNSDNGVKYVQNKSSYKCQYCGTTNPEDFYNYNHSTCKKCGHQRSYEQKKSSPLNIKLYRSSKHSRTHGGDLEYNLTPEYIQQLLEKQNYKCFYTGVELKDSDSKFEKPTIDRIDSSKGYIKENVVICTWAINAMKNDMTIEEFYNQINLIKNNEMIVKENLSVS